VSSILRSPSIPTTRDQLDRTFTGFRKYVIERAQTRVYALRNISTIGRVVANERYFDPKTIDPQAAIATIQQNRSLILGIKVSTNGRHDDQSHDIKVLKKPREASNATRVPIMLHRDERAGSPGDPQEGRQYCAPLQSSKPNPSNLVSGDRDKILPQILVVRERGILDRFFARRSSFLEGRRGRR
jgi:hypothetical protein